MPFIRVVLGIKPSFVKEVRSSETYVNWNIAESLTNYFFPLRSIKDNCTPKSGFEDLILPRETKENILNLATSVCTSHTAREPFKHAILHGPDREGKCMAAKRLARVAGINFAHICGPDITTPSETQTLFNWAKLSTDGILLFVDESEAFLGSTESSLMNEMSEHSRERNSLSVFLYNMSKLGNKIILVLSANRLEDLDREILDRLDERIFVPLPDASCRKELVLIYWRKFVEQSNANAYSIKSRLIQLFTGQKRPILSIEDEAIMAGEQLEEIVASTRGFSGGEIKDMVFSLEGAMRGSEGVKLDFAKAWKLIEAKVKNHRDNEAIAGEDAHSYLDGDTDLQVMTFV